MNPAALELARGKQATASAISSVAAATSPEAAAWAFTQWELRKRASAKFGRAAEMLFTREALEQATHEAVAAYHASRFPDSALVADLTAGIGADLIALAKRGAAKGFEIDAERAALCSHNLAAHSLKAEVRLMDCLVSNWDFDYAIADPARRMEGRRTLEPTNFSPDPVELARRMAGLKLGGIKLSPMLPDGFLEGLGGCLEFVSFCGECREALVWLGSESTRGRFAVRVETGSRLSPPETGSTILEEPAECFYEADPAAIRAHCLPALCEMHGLAQLGDSNGYLTGGPIDSEWLSGFQVLCRGSHDERAERRLLEELGASGPEIKSRASVDVHRLRKSLRLDGKRSVFLAIYPVGRKLKFAILEKLP